MKLSLVSLSWLLPLVSGEATSKEASPNTCSVLYGDSCLTVAQALRAPESTRLYGGETEHFEWWDKHEDLLRRAWKEWGCKHHELYQFNDEFEERFLDPMLVQAFRTRDLKLLETLLNPTNVPNVYTVQLFQPEFAALLLDELDRHEKSKIPMRRPNGMNRYGTILAYMGFDDLISDLVSRYLTRLAQHLFPNFAGPQDLTHHYAFTVRYRPGEDSMLSDHADASLVTVNVCLEPTNQSNVLYFLDHRTLQSMAAFNSTVRGNTEPAFVDLSTPGLAVVHLGQIVHGVKPVRDTRTNMVLWLFGEHGSVRVDEYEPKQVELHKFVSQLSWLEHEYEATQITENRKPKEDL